MGDRAPGFIRRAARGVLEEELGFDPGPVLAMAARRFADAGCERERGAQVRTYLVALRQSLLDGGCSGEQTSALIAGSVSRAVEQLRLPLELAAWWRHPRNRLARARWRQQEASRLFFSERHAPV